MRTPTLSGASNAGPTLPGANPALPPANAAGPAFLAPQPYRALKGAKLRMREFLFGPAYQKYQVALTIAGGGTGKTSLCIAEAVAMAAGKRFLAEPVRPLRVWIYNGEEPLDEIDRRVRAAAMAQGLDHEQLRERLFVNSGRGRNRIDLSRHSKDKRVEVNDPLIMSLIESIRGKIDVVIVDPFISTHSIPENDNTGIDLMAKAWGRIAEEGECAVHLVHHASKGGASDSADASRGASALAAAARYVRNLAQMTDKEAKAFGIREDELRRHVGIRVTKQNNSAISGTEWFKLGSIAIGNDPDPAAPGDVVGIVEPFEPQIEKPDLPAMVGAALDALSDPRNIYNFGSPNWFGYAIAEQLGIDGKAHRDLIESLIEFMLKYGAIETYNNPGKNGRARDCVRGGGGYAVTAAGSAPGTAPGPGGALDGSVDPEAAHPAVGV